MSVYTEIPEATIADICTRFGVEFKAMQPIQNGVENSNWFITAADDRQFVLTLFEERSATEVKTLARLMLALEQAGLPVAAPLTHDDGGLHGMYQDKAIQLAPRLSGTHPDTATAAMCEHMGEALALLHESFSELEPAENYTLAQFPWEDVRNTYMPTLLADDKKLMYKIWQAYERAQVNASANTGELPKGLTHGDLFLDNTLWQDSELTGLLDFTEVSVDHLLMDIAITANDCCTDWIDLTFDEDKLAEFISGYESVRTLTPTEKDALPAFLAMAAVRFWLLRLDIAAQNTEQNRGGDHVLVKSPELMRELAEVHFHSL